MKKAVIFLFFCFGVGLPFAEPVCAQESKAASRPQAVVSGEYSRAELMQKVKNMEVLDFKRMPSSFWYLAGDAYLSKQEDINIFYMAKNRYERNPNQFVAVFNYATVILGLNAGEGCACSDMQLDEAYRLLERAQKLRSDYLPVYQQQDFVLMFKIFGPVWAGPGYDEEDAVVLYRKMPDLARKRLAVQEKLIAQGEGDLYTAWQICQALQRSASAAKYQQMMEEQKAALRAQRYKTAEEFARNLAVIGSRIQQSSQERRRN